MKTLLALEEFLLDSFTGCLVLVSHDQYFLNKIAEHLFVFEGNGQIQDFPSSYYDYLDYRKQKKKEVKENSSTGKKEIPVQASKSEDTTKSEKPQQAAKGNALNYNERKEFNKLEKELQKLQSQVQELEDKLAENSNGGFSAIYKINQDLQKVKEQLATKEARWMELAERA